VNSTWINEIVSGWTISGPSEIHSGTARGVIDSTNNTGTYSDGVRPNLTGSLNNLSSSRPRALKVKEWFDHVLANDPNGISPKEPPTVARPSLWMEEVIEREDCDEICRFLILGTR
jgi:hypothetical protein